ncbi:hypothetical protein [Arcicella rosea]|uniref:ABC-type Fe3+ transport system permease subunit n=1 Tax=Arcicella rosea TaxID=502909 RepID=A0A841ESI4_9BACT|nr:hypothetical protein [Arcicella rosea]MBB6003993.1 ABC-type Fe3+ transport system permease subunit [Arcicella rosea]
MIPSSSNHNNLAQNVIEAISTSSSTPDPTTASLIAALKQAELESMRQDTDQRKLYARLIFWMVSIWLFAIFLVIVFTGMKSFTISTCGFFLRHKTSDYTINFSLSDNVLIALITTTTINVCAFFLAVTQYLFPSKKKESNTNDSV